MTREDSFQDYPFYGRGGRSYGHHGHQQHGQHHDGHHHHHHHHSNHNHHIQPPIQSFAYPPPNFRRRPSSPISSNGRSTPDSDSSSTYDSKSSMRWIISLGLLLPALAAIIGVVAWAVSAEVVMGAQRESALKASEAFRFSQGPHDLEWRTVDEEEALNSVPVLDPKHDPKQEPKQPEEKEEQPPPKLAAIQESGTRSLSQSGATTSEVTSGEKDEDDDYADDQEDDSRGSSKKEDDSRGSSKQEDHQEDDGKGPTWETSSYAPSSSSTPVSSSTTTTTTSTSTTTTTTESTLSAVFKAIKNMTPKKSGSEKVDGNSFSNDKEADEENDEETSEEDDEKETAKDSLEKVQEPESPKVNGSSIFFLNGVDTGSSSGDNNSGKKVKTPGDQVAEVINRLVAQRLNKNGVRPHIVVVAPVSDSRKKASTTTTKQPLDVAASMKIKAVVSKRIKTLTTEAPSESKSKDKPKAILSRDADTLLAAAQMLATRHKLISMRNDQDFDEESTAKTGDASTTTPAPSHPAFQASHPHGHGYPAETASHSVVSMHHHPQNQQHRPFAHHPLHATSINGPPVVPHFGSFAASHPKHVQSDRMGQTPMASHFTPTHVVPPPGHVMSPSVHRPVIPTGIPPHPGLQLNNVHPSGLPPQHLVHHHQGPVHPHPHHFRFLQGPHHPRDPRARPQQFHPQFMPHQLPQGHPGLMPPQGIPQSLPQGLNQGLIHGPTFQTPQNIQPTEAATEPTEESQLSANFGSQTSEGNPQKAVIQFHTPDSQAAESGANKGLTLHFGGGPMAGGGQLMTSPVGIFKTLLLPLLPKPRVNLNGKVVFGVVLEKGVGFGKQQKKQPHAVKFNPAQLYSGRR